MTDIVERLRNVDLLDDFARFQAADEIERLRRGGIYAREIRAEVRAATIEECASVCHDLILDQKKPDPEAVRAAIAAAIRALKGRVPALRQATAGIARGKPDMTNIVELLRAEIERLREDLADWKQAASIEAGLRCEFRDQCATIRAATIEEYAKPLEQIRLVCADNAGKRSNHKMALDFVHQIAIRALKEQK